MNYQQIKTQYPNLDVIPVLRNSKVPLRTNWQRISPEKQWEGLDGDYNLGVRPSNNLMIFDADSTETEIKLLELFPDATIDQTQSGGKHYFIFTDDITPIKTRYNKQYKTMKTYQGEIRFGAGSQTLLPPSKVKRKDGSIGHYTLLQGDFKTIPTYPSKYIIECMDMLIGKEAKKLAVRQGISRASSFDSLLIPLHKRGLYNHLQEKLEWLSTAQAKDSYSAYGQSWDTRNQLEFDIMGDLILAGWDIYEIQDVFDEYQSGHYIESSNPDKYIEKLYESAMKNLASKPLVDELQRAWVMADTTNISSKQRVIVLALLSTALQFTSREFRLSKLSITGLTSMLGNHTVNQYLDEVIDEYSIGISYNEDGRILYDISEMLEFFLKEYDVSDYSQYNLKRYKVQTLADNLEEYLTTIYRMGDTRLNILSILKNTIKTVPELAEILGVTRQGVMYHIKRLSIKGLVEKIGNKIHTTSENIVEALSIKDLITYVSERIADKLEAWAFFQERMGLTELGVRNMEMYHAANRVNKYKKTVLA